MPESVTEAVEAGAEALWELDQERVTEVTAIPPMTWKNLTPETRAFYIHKADRCMTRGMMATIDELTRDEREAYQARSIPKAVCFKAAGAFWAVGSKVHDLGVWFGRRARG